MAVQPELMLELQTGLILRGMHPDVQVSSSIPHPFQDHMASARLVKKPSDSWTGWCLLASACGR